MRRVAAVVAGVASVAVVAAGVWAWPQSESGGGGLSPVASVNSVPGAASELVCAGQACVLSDVELSSVRTSGVVDLAASGVPAGVQSVAVSPLAGQDASALVGIEEGRLVDMRALPPGPYLLTVSTGSGVFQLKVIVEQLSPPST